MAAVRAGTPDAVAVLKTRGPAALLDSLPAVYDDSGMAALLTDTGVLPRGPRLRLPGVRLVFAPRVPLT